MDAKKESEQFLQALIYNLRQINFEAVNESVLEWVGVHFGRRLREVYEEGYRAGISAYKERD